MMSDALFVSTLKRREHTLANNHQSSLMEGLHKIQVAGRIFAAAVVKKTMLIRQLLIRNIF